MTTERFIYEYCIVRYVADVERQEFLNVGLLMMCKRRKWMRAAILLDEPRLRALFPSVDIEALRCQLALFQRTDVPQADLPVEERYRWLAAVKSAVLQTSPSHPGIILADETSDPATIDARLLETFRLLLNRLVASPV